MERPKPTKQLMLEVCGENQGLLSSVHHGLYETSALRNIYPVLNLDELLAFTASSWKGREARPDNMKQLTESADLYTIFNDVFSIGFPRLNKHKNVSAGFYEKHKAMNPFVEGLKERLSQVSSEADADLRKQLAEKVNKHVFECQYQSEKAMRGGDNYKLVIMRFQNVYPKKGKIVPAFAAEVSKIIGTYPAEYNDSNNPF